MSAAKWRRAMNTGIVDLPEVAPARSTATRAMPRPAGATECADRAAAGGSASLRAIRPHHVVVLVAVLVYPFVATPFFTFQIGAQALGLGLIALSLTFLGGYGGMVSLAQMTVAGLAGYLVAIFGHSSVASISLGWPWWLAASIAIAGSTLFATLVGWLSVRTEGIYTIMITLAIGVAFFYLAQQNYTVFNGHGGFSQVVAPRLGDIDWRAAGPVLLPRARLRARRLLLRRLHRARAVRHRAAGHPRQPAAHERARLRRHRAPRRRLCGGRRARRGRRRADRLVQRPHLAGLDRTPAR